MSKQKKYLLEVNAVGTLEQIEEQLRLFMWEFSKGLNDQVLEEIIEDKNEHGEKLYLTQIMTAEVKEIAN